MWAGVTRLGLPSIGVEADVHLRHRPQRLDQRVADDVGEGDLAAAGAGEVVVDDGAVVPQQLDRHRADRGRGRDAQRGVHVLRRTRPGCRAARCRSARPWPSAGSAGLVSLATGALGAGGGLGRGGDLARLGDRGRSLAARRPSWPPASAAVLLRLLLRLPAFAFASGCCSGACFGAGGGGVARRRWWPPYRCPDRCDWKNADPLGCHALRIALVLLEHLLDEPLVGPELAGGVVGLLAWGLRHGGFASSGSARGVSCWSQPSRLVPHASKCAAPPRISGRLARDTRDRESVPMTSDLASTRRSSPSRWPSASLAVAGCSGGDEAPDPARPAESLSEPSEAPDPRGRAGDEVRARSSAGSRGRTARRVEKAVSTGRSGA